MHQIGAFFVPIHIISAVFHPRTMIVMVIVPTLKSVLAAGQRSTAVFYSSQMLTHIMKTNQDKRRNRVRRQHREDVVRIPREVFDIIRSQAAVTLSQALMLEELLCTRKKQ